MSAPQHRRGSSRSKIVRRWAAAVMARNHIPLPVDELEERLAGLFGILLGTLTSEPFRPETAYECGVRLVAMHCAGPEGIRSTMDSLGAGLGAMPELAGLRQRTERIFSTLGAMAAGYAEATRQTTFAQQEALHRAALAAVSDVHRKLRDVSAELDHVLAGCTTGVALTDQEGRFLRANTAFQEILGYRQNELTGLTLLDVIPPRDAGLFRSLLAGGTPRFQRAQRLVGKDQQPAWASLTMSGPRADSFLLVLEDRTELRLLQSRLNHMALHDMLTGLPNRQFFTTRLETALARGVTLCHLDLDGFTAISQGLGRQTSDAVLMQVAQRLRAAVAAEDTMVARFGADEFAVLMPSTPADMIVRHLQQTLRQPIDVAGHKIVLTAAIGVVTSADASPAAVLDAAELALARAKRRGPGQWSGFDADDRDRVRASAVLPSALRSGQVTVTYRPLLGLPGQEVAGFDAELSWGCLSHWDCVVRAQNWLVRKVCTSGPGLPVHVGLTAPDAGDVRRIVEDTGRPAESLCLSVPADDNLLALAETGVGVEIRDFGLADLAFLEALPIRAVRLGRNLRRPGVLTAKALRHVIATVRSAGVSVIVDGLAAPQEARRWQDLGADLAALDPAALDQEGR